MHACPKFLRRTAVGGEPDSFPSPPLAVRAAIAFYNINRRAAMKANRRAFSNSTTTRHVSGASPMEYRLLGRSGLKISTLTMGTMTFGNSQKIGDTDLAHAQRQIDLCLDAGVNLIDTANVYAAGKSESTIGEALAGGRRDRALLATKVRFPMGEAPNDR